MQAKHKQTNEQLEKALKLEQLPGLTELQTSKLKKIVKQLCKPLFSLPSVKAVFMYGSCTKHYVPGHDIDILVIIDDTKQLDEKESKKIDILMQLIAEKASKQALILHFQPPKPLSLFWDLIRKAEPWIISGLRQSVILYDPSGYLRVIKKLIMKGQLYSIDEKAERLSNRATERFIEVRELLLKVPLQLLWAMTEATQIVLAYLNIFTSSATDTLAKLKHLAKKINISEKHVKNFEELLAICEKIAKGTLSEFSGKEIELWVNRVKNYIIETEDILLKLEKMKKFKQVVETYERALKICDRALSMKIKQLPHSIEQRIKLFKKELVDKGLIDKEYYDMLKTLHNYISKKAKQIPKQYLAQDYIKKLEASVEMLALKIKKIKNK